ncbi:TAXI family TRAP transporter solute-binding subunit [Bradyrhizobium sp. 13971]
MIAGDYAYGFWRYLSIAGALAIFLGAGAFIMATLPPRELVMATGAEGSANYELGIRYREILAKEGVKLQLQPTSGSLENLKYLRDPRSRVSVGFIQGGTTTGKEAPELESLGTIFYEPLWLFRRSEIGEGVQALRGRRLSIGAEGSGGRALALQIMQRTRIDSIVGEISGYAPQAAAEKLVAGDIDAAFIVTAWEFPVVQSILNAKGIELSSAQRADAFVAIYPFLHKLVLPAGVIDLLANRPPADVVLLAPKASLVVRADLHSALQYVLLNAAAEIHSQPGIFQKAGEFPAAEFDRHSAQPGSATLLQDRAAVPARLSPILGSDAGGEGGRRAAPAGRLAVPGVQVPAADLRLDDAAQDQAAVRRDQVDRERDECRGQEDRRQRIEREAGSHGSAREPDAIAECLCEQPLYPAEPHRSRAHPSGRNGLTGTHDRTAS